MKNHYETHDGIAKVYCNGKNRTIFFFIDASDLAIISDYSWRCEALNKGRYNIIVSSINVGNKKIKHIILSRLLLNAPIGSYVDHKDCNPLNNTRSNLRLATPSENSRNVPKTANKRSSQYKGVSWHIRKQKWIATVAINSKNRFIGYFNSESEAANAYNKKAKELHGEFAKLNELGK